MRTNFLLTENVGWCEGNFEVQGGQIGEWNIQASSIQPAINPSEFLTEGLPVEYHCHGISHFDFSNLDTAEMYAINEYLVRVGIQCILTCFLPNNKLDQFTNFLFNFQQEKKAGNLGNILGVALEGPLLASKGGTPQSSSWAPTKGEWKKLVKYASPYLHYVVIAPDALLENGSWYDVSMNADYPNLDWLLTLFLDYGIRPSLGHFDRYDSKRVLQGLFAMLDFVEKNGSALKGPFAVTDHLFNDMALNFKHAWRTPEERLNRRRDLEILDLDNLRMDNIDEKLGVVPATLIKAAKNGVIIPSINFDGDHVDFEISRHMINFLGSQQIIAMTDNTSLTRQLCGQTLVGKPFNSLLYQDDDVVAAGTQSIYRQIDNMKELGIPIEQIWDMVCFVPRKMLNLSAMELTLDNSLYTYFNNRAIKPVTIHNGHRN